MSDYERLLDDFGRELHRAAHTPLPRRPWRRPGGLAFAGAALAAAVTAVVLLSPSGHGRLDVLAQARAALAPDGEVVHLVLTSTPTGTGIDVSRVPRSSTTEQWSAIDPVRWRFVQTLPRPGTKSGGSVGDAEGRYWGRQEFAYADHVQADYVAMRDRLSATRGFSGKVGSHMPGPLALSGTDADPVSALRAMLDRHELKDSGEVVVNGRKVHRLVASSTVRRFTRSVAYDVDADTFVPVQARLSWGQTGKHPFRLSQLIHVDRYEKLPLDDAGAKLLTIAVTPSTKLRLRDKPRAKQHDAGRACDATGLPIHCMR